MANLSDYAENKLNDHLLGNTPYSPASNLYLRLYTAAPNDAGGGTEVSGGSYAPGAIANNATNFPAAASRIKSNGVEFAFPQATAGWGTVSHWAIWDASSGGNMLVWGRFEDSLGAPAPRTVLTNNTFKISAGVLKLTATGAKTTYCWNKLLDLMFGALAFAAPATLYFALFTAAPTENGGGTEVAGGSYARVSQTNNTTNFPNSAAGSKQNATAVTFPTASAGWGTITHVGIFDANASGNLLSFAQFAASEVINTGGVASYPAGSFTFTEN